MMARYDLASKVRHRSPNVNMEDDNSDTITPTVGSYTITAKSVKWHGSHEVFTLSWPRVTC